MCLMSLDKSEAVPIDTHVWQIAKRDYNFASGKAQKSITDKLHRDIGWFLFSSYVAFYACLHSSKPRIMLFVIFFTQGTFSESCGALMLAGHSR